jgi:hypothetical protein
VRNGNIISAPTFAPSGEDRIQLFEQHEVAPPGTVETVLQTAPNITWRKGVETDRVLSSYGCHWWWGWHCSWSHRPFDSYHAQSGSRYTFTWLSD